MQMTNEELAILIKAGDTAATGQLWEQTKRLLLMFANRYHTRLYDRCVAAGVTRDDLYQECYFVMLDAVAAWTPESGHQVSSYIKFHTQNRFRSLLGIRSTRRDALNQCSSLDEPLPGTEDITLADSVPDPDAAIAFDSAEDAIFTRQLRGALESAIDTLPEREGFVTRAVHFQGQKVKDIAAALGVSYSRCQAMRHQALRGLRRDKALRYLQQYRDVIATTAYRGGLSSFRTTHTSSTELAVIRLERRTDKSYQFNRC